jgi:DNA gyrase subunit B
MYIGSTSTSGLCHLIYEAVDNAVDEANAGHGKKIWVSIDKKGWVTVRDEARGMPFDLKEYRGKQVPAATLIMTVPHSGGKFEEGVYKTAGGLHGVGATVINALSEELQLTIWRDGRQFQQTFRKGNAGRSAIEDGAGKKHGTEMRWLYDSTIFDTDAHYAPELIESRLQAAAYLNRGLTIEFSYFDPEAGPRGQMATKTYASKEGVADYARFLTPPDTNALFQKPLALAKVRDDVSVEVALLPNTRAERPGAQVRRHQGPREARLQGGRYPAGPGRNRLGQARQPAVPGTDQRPAE